jgi:hypothetical protein
MAYWLIKSEPGAPPTHPRTRGATNKAGAANK